MATAVGSTRTPPARTTERRPEMNDERARPARPSAAAGNSAPPDRIDVTNFDADGHVPDETLARFVDEPANFNASARAELERHLANCAACAAALDDLYGIIHALRTLPQVEP